MNSHQGTNKAKSENCEECFHPLNLWENVTSNYREITEH